MSNWAIFFQLNRVLPNSSSYSATASAERATDDRDGHTDNHTGRPGHGRGWARGQAKRARRRHITPTRDCGGRRLGHRKTARTLTRTRETTGPAWNGMGMEHVGRGEHDTSNTHHSRKYIAGGAQRNISAASWRRRGGGTSQPTWNPSPRTRTNAARGSPSPAPDRVAPPAGCPSAQ